MDLERKYCYNKMLWLRPNKYYAEILQELYCGTFGEVKAFMQESYQSFTLLPYGDKIGKVLDQFASEDLFHSKQLAECIVMLGENPIYHSKTAGYLNTKTLNYSANFSQIFAENIAFKEEQIIAYKTALSKINNNYLKNLISSIIKDEENQLFVLKELKAQNNENSLHKNANLC